MAAWVLARRSAMTASTQIGFKTSSQRIADHGRCVEQERGATTAPMPHAQGRRERLFSRSLDAGHHGANEVLAVGEA